MELLSPAGNIEKLQYAIAYGADAVYAGSQDFSLRAKADNFTFADLQNATEHCHAQGKKIYVPLNIYAHNRHIAPIKEYITNLATAGIDAVIVSDIGIFSLVKALAPNIPIHISTQANVTSYQAVQAWQNLGAKRIILARELTATEISDIRQQCPDIQLEIFVHGAMCMAYSGRCLLSAYLNNKHSNLGECTHPCRWKYQLRQQEYCLIEESRPNQTFPIDEDQHGFYLLNSKDLCLWHRLEQIYKMGIDSVKIEGRMKSIYYISVITRAYKHAITQISQGKQPDSLYTVELNKISHRLYTEGFFAENADMQNYTTAQYNRQWQFVGNIVSFTGDLAMVRSFHKITNTDTIEIIFPQKECDMVVVKPEMYDQEMNNIVFTKPNTHFYLRLQPNLPEFGIIRVGSK